MRPSLFKWLEGRSSEPYIILLSFPPIIIYLLHYIIFLPFRTGFGPSLFLANIPLAFFECSCTSSSLFLFLSYSTILWSIVLSSACRDDHILERKAKRLCCFLGFSNLIANILNATSSFALKSGIPESSSLRVLESSGHSRPLSYMLQAARANQT